MYLNKFVKELKAKGYLIDGDNVVTAKGDVVGSMDPYGVFQSKDEELLAAIWQATKAQLEVPVKTLATKVKKIKKTAGAKRGESNE